MIVRSAVNDVSNTRLNPILRRAATMRPSTSAPGARPNSSAIETETAGACCATTKTSGSASALSTSSTFERSCRAPVGHATTHWPQLMQLDTLRPLSKAVPTNEREPRPMKSMAETPWISSQMRTHLPQRTHLSGSRTMDGLETSWSRSVFSPR